MQILMICPSWRRICGVADYTRFLVEAYSTIGLHVQVAENLEQVKNIIKREKFNAVHIQHEYSLYSIEELTNILTTCLQAGIPVLSTMHTIIPQGHLVQHHTLLVSHCRTILTHSCQSREVLISTGIAPSLVQVINQGCPDYSRNFGNSQQVREALQIPAHVFLVGFFGFAFPNKGIVPLVNALRKVEGVWGYIQASEHFLAPWCFGAICKELNLSTGGDQDCVRNNQIILSKRYLPQEKVGSFMHAMDMIILPYSQQFQGVYSTSAAVRSALAGHRPVVTSNAPSFSDLTSEVYKLPDITVEYIQEAIQKIKNDANLREQLTLQAKRYAVQNRWEIIARRHMDIYRKIGCGPVLTQESFDIYIQHHDSIFDSPIQQERVRWLWQNIQGSVLELGCACGFITEYCGGILGIDKDPGRVRVARHVRRGPQFEVHDVTKRLPYPDQSFETVLLPELLQDIAWEKVPQVLRESARIGRRLLITSQNGLKAVCPEHQWSATPEKIHFLLSGLTNQAHSSPSIKVLTSPGSDFVYALFE